MRSRFTGGRAPRRTSTRSSEISGVEFAQAWPGREALDANGVTISVIGREDLMRNKTAAARPQDLADVDALERQARAPKPR